MAADTPDFDRLEQLSREVDDLVAAGKWNKKEFERVRTLAKDAAGPNASKYPGLLEFLALNSSLSWV